MNKIDELQAKISACYRNRQELVKALDNEVQKYEKELAALEAQAKGPREFVLGLDAAGNMCSISRYGSDVHYHLHGYSGGYPRNLIPLIEKLPVKSIVITKAKAARMHHEWAKTCIDYAHPNGWVNALKAIGLDAVEAE